MTLSKVKYWHQGKKTYVAGGLLILWAALGLIMGRLDQVAAIPLILEGAGFIGARAGIAKLLAILKE